MNRETPSIKRTTALRCHLYSCEELIGVIVVHTTKKYSKGIISEIIKS